MDERSRKNFNEESSENKVDRREMDHDTLGFKVIHMNKMEALSLLLYHLKLYIS